MKFSSAGMRGWIEDDIFRLLPSSFLEDPFHSIQVLNGQLIKESKWRRAALVTLPEGQKIFLKIDKTKDWLEYFKYLFLPSKARKEWFVTSRLRRRRLPVPKPLGWIEKRNLGSVKESLYLSEVLGTGESASEQLETLQSESVVRSLAETVRRFHDAGLTHNDLHIGNFLWVKGDLFLTDLHNASIRKATSLKQRLWNITHLFHSLRSVLGEKEQRTFIEIYFGKEISPLEKMEAFLEHIHDGMDRLQRRQWRSRTKRCLKNSTEFSFEKEGSLTFFRRKDFILDKVNAVLEGHWNLVREKPERLAKNSSRVIVSVTQGGDEKFVVKHFRSPHLSNRLKDLLRKSKGRKAWIGGNGLKARGISSVQPLALVERNHGLGPKESFFLMETLEGSQELDRYILQGLGDFRRKRIFIRAFAGWLADLYNKKVYHKDMKTCNFLVVEKQRSWDFYLLDLEDVRFGQRVTERKLFKNFFQLNTSTPRIISQTDRLRFAKECLGRIPDIKNPKRLLRQVVQESLGEDVVYVSPHGTVIEKL
jgi:tRNA A-37 threonylcarbamoyl transferase component Bud32